jgi:hypothetical protein
MLGNSIHCGMDRDENMSCPARTALCQKAMDFFEVGKSPASIPHSHAMP